MNTKRTCILFYLLLNCQCSFAQEHKHEHHLKQPKARHARSSTPDLHITIDIPERPHTPEPHTPQDIKRLKIKTAAVTAIITALIGAGVSIYLGLHNCN
jgi:hypothetical protein